jgi:uncharacterized membrane protein YesL
LYSPAFIPFFSAVSITWILMYGGMYSFRKIEARQKHRQLEQFRHSGLSRHI